MQIFVIWKRMLGSQSIALMVLKCFGENKVMNNYFSLS